jgi:hypothetical protein
MMNPCGSHPRSGIVWPAGLLKGLCASDQVGQSGDNSAKASLLVVGPGVIGDPHDRLNRNGLDGPGAEQRLRESAVTHQRVSDRGHIVIPRLRVFDQDRLT